MKKWLAFTVSLLLVLSVCACGSKNTSSGEDPSSGTVGSVALESAAAPASSEPGKSGESESRQEQPNSDKGLYQTVFESETAWLASLQLDNGAIPMTVSKSGAVSMNPYFADFAALALLDAPEQYAGHVKKYMEWHFSHLNTAATDYNGVDGTIYDYTLSVADGKVTGERITEKDGKKSYDSTDSYAATFLTVLNKYRKATNDSSYILSRKADIARIFQAMLATADGGLTTAKPDYAVKYLMDNCEVYEGAVSAAELFRVIAAADASYQTVLAQCERTVKQVSAAIENELWNVAGGYYEAGLFQNGEVAYSFSWKTYYPCATAQLFPITSGLIPADSERAKALYQGFCGNYDWQNMKIPDSFYWGSNVYAAALMKDTERVNTYLTHYQKIMKRHAYPLYNADAAKVCMAAYLMMQQ